MCENKNNIYKYSAYNEQKQTPYDIIDADFEAYTKNDKGENIQHKPFLLCAVSTKEYYEWTTDGDIY